MSAAVDSNLVVEDVVMDHPNELSVVEEEVDMEETEVTPAQAFFNANIEASLNFLEMQDSLGKNMLFSILLICFSLYCITLFVLCVYIDLSLVCYIDGFIYVYIDMDVDVTQQLVRNKLHFSKLKLDYIHLETFQGILENLVQPPDEKEAQKEMETLGTQFIYSVYTRYTSTIHNEIDIPMLTYLAYIY